MARDRIPPAEQEVGRVESSSVEESMRLNREMNSGLRLRRNRDESAGRAQAGQGDRYKATDRGRRTVAAGSRQCVDAVACELVGRHIVPDVAGPCRLGEQVSDHVVDLA